MAAASEKIHPLWESRIDRSENGTLKKLISNFRIILENHPEWRGRFRHDEFSGEIEIFDKSDWRRISDSDGRRFCDWVGTHYGVSLSRDMALDAMLLAAENNSINSVQSWLTGLSWDGTPRLRSMLAEAFGTERDEYHSQCGTLFFAALAARIMSPGCKFDNAFIFSGAQGTRKSSALEVIASDRLYIAMTGTPGTPDFNLRTVGKIIYDMSEMAAFGKAADEIIKHIITERFFEERRPYGRVSTVFKRSGIFCGTTNLDEILRDPTGSRRFLIINCGDINTDYLSENRDQLFAEGLIAHTSNPQWWKPPEGADEHQHAASVTDSWEPLIEKWLEGKCEAIRYPDHINLRNVHISDVLHYALGVEAQHQDMQRQKRVSSILRTIGYRKSNKRIDGKQQKTWVRPELSE